MKKYQKIPGFLSICLSVAAMAAGGGASIGISKAWKREFLFPEEETQFKAGALCKVLPVPVTEDSKKEKEEPRAVTLEGDMLPDTRLTQKIELSQERKKDERSPERLNVAFYFDIGDEEDISHSYGARLYQSLSEKDSSWIQGIYSRVETPPDQMAAAQGMDIGGISSWNRVIVTFRDGDGTPISGYSNAKEILSLASVFGYFQGWEDYDDFLEYAAALWNRSHGYEVSMSQVYYCEEECQYLEKQEGSGENHEEESQEERGETAVGGPEERESGEAADDLRAGESGTGAADLGEQESGEAAGDLRVQESGTAADGLEERETREGTESTEVHENGAVADGLLGEPESGEAAGDLRVQESGTVADGLGERESGDGTVSTEVQENGTVADSLGERESQDMSGLNGQGNDMALESVSSGSQGNGEDHLAGPGETLESQGNGGSETLEPGDGESGENSQEGQTEPVMSSESQEAGQAAGQETGEASCHGHVDLNISIRITGLKENQSLYEADPAGKQEISPDSQWEGWDEEAKSFCETLAGQDWYELYGIASSPSLYVRDPLTQSEIAFYLNKLPDNTSPKRREVVRQALSSVGRIPYYWGGKPSRGGMEGNGFGTITKADEDGRILKGLDCSGWISWVYWTAFGSPLPAQSTSGLVSCGRGIAKEELRPGDILIRTGEQPHVYLFLAWAEDGSMYLIHETTGYVNNVMIDTYDVELPYYRDLIGEE